MNNTDIRYMCKEEKMANFLALRLELFRDEYAMPFDDRFIEMARNCCKNGGIDEEQVDGTILAALDLFLDLGRVNTDRLLELYTHWITDESLPKELGRYVVRAIRDEIHARH